MCTTRCVETSLYRISILITLIHVENEKKYYDINSEPRVRSTFIHTHKIAKNWEFKEKQRCSTVHVGV